MTPVVVTFFNDIEEYTLGPFNQGVVTEKAKAVDELHLIDVASGKLIARCDLFFNNGAWEIEPQDDNAFDPNLSEFGRMFVQAHNTGGTA